MGTRCGADRGIPAVKSLANQAAVRLQGSKCQEKEKSCPLVVLAWPLSKRLTVTPRDSSSPGANSPTIVQQLRSPKPKVPCRKGSRLFATVDPNPALAAPIIEAAGQVGATTSQQSGKRERPRPVWRATPAQLLAWTQMAQPQEVLAVRTRISVGVGASQTSPREAQGDVHAC